MLPNAVVLVRVTVQHNVYLKKPVGWIEGRGVCDVGIWNSELRGSSKDWIYFDEQGVFKI